MSGVYRGPHESVARAPARAVANNQVSRRLLSTLCAASLWLTCMTGCAATGAGNEKIDVRRKPVQSAEIEPLPPPSVAELIGRGDSALNRGELNLAIVEYVKALVEDPENPVLLVKIGDAQRELGQNEIAERAFSEALRHKPNDPAALEGMGLVLMNLRRGVEARERLVAALEVEPRRWRALNALGIMSDLSGDLDQAKAHFIKALETSPQPSLVLNNLGYSFYLSGDLVQAQRYFEEALTTDADNRKAWSNLALIHVRKQQFPEALDAFSRILSKPESLNSVGYLCMITVQLECASEHFQRAIKASPVYYSEAYANLSRVQLRMAGRSPDLLNP